MLSKAVDRVIALAETFLFTLQTTTWATLRKSQSPFLLTSLLAVVYRVIVCWILLQELVLFSLLLICISCWLQLSKWIRRAMGLRSSD